MSTGEMTPLVRQWLLLQSLANRRNGLTIKEMAEDAGVTMRTIRRDLQTLQQIGLLCFPRLKSRGPIEVGWRCSGSLLGFIVL